LAATGLSSAGNLTPVATECEFLEEIGDGLAHGQEFDLNAALGRHARDSPSHAEWFGEGIA
jgi:hypothetical protein